MEFLPFLKDNASEIDVYFRIRSKYPNVDPELAIKTLVVINQHSIKYVKKLARYSQFTSIQDVLNHIVVNELPEMPYTVSLGALNTFGDLVQVDDTEVSANDIKLYIPFIEALYLDEAYGMLQTSLINITTTDIHALTTYKSIFKNLKDHLVIKSEDSSQPIYVKTLSDLEHNIMSLIVRPITGASSYKFVLENQENTSDIPF